MDPISRMLYDFEPDPGGAADPAGDPAGEPVEPAVEPAEPVQPELSTGWSAEDPAFREAVASEAESLIQGRFGPLVQLVEQLQSAQSGSPQTQVGELPELDPFDPESVTRYQDARDARLLGAVEQMIGKVAQPLQAREEQEAITAGEERVKDIINDEISRNGELGAKATEAIGRFAPIFFQEAEQRYGFGPRAAEVAVTQAAQLVREIVQEASTASVTADRNRALGLAGVRPEPGGAAAGAPGLEEFRTPSDVVRAYTERARVLREAG